jgi:hypothetical protein
MQSGACQPAVQCFAASSTVRPSKQQSTTGSRKAGGRRLTSSWIASACSRSITGWSAGGVACSAEAHEPTSVAALRPFMTSPTSRRRRVIWRLKARAVRVATP